MPSLPIEEYLGLGFRDLVKSFEIRVSGLRLKLQGSGFMAYILRVDGVTEELASWCLSVTRGPWGCCLRYATLESGSNSSWFHGNWKRRNLNPSPNSVERHFFVDLRHVCHRLGAVWILVFEQPLQNVLQSQDVVRRGTPMY